MNLYLISQDVNSDYDTYSDAVVAAETEEEAKKIHPDGGNTLPLIFDDDNWEDWEKSSAADKWVATVELVSVRLIGIAADDVQPGVVLASYHAG